MSINVVKEKVDVKIPEGNVGIKIEEDKLNRKLVSIRLYKGTSHANREALETKKLIMLKVRIVFEGNLKKYIPIDSLVAKEIVESMDIDLEIIEVWLNKKLPSRQNIVKVMSPIVDKYYGSDVGNYLGSLRMYYGDFIDFVNFIRYLAYEPIKNENVGI